MKKVQALYSLQHRHSSTFGPRMDLKNQIFLHTA